MKIDGTLRVIETNSHETANQYLRFGWNLINQYAVEATEDQPAMVKFVLAAIRRLEDTREIVISSEPGEVNEYLSLGWKLIDKHATSSESTDRRHETIHFVLAWQRDEEPLRLGAPPIHRKFEMNPGSIDDL